MVSILSLQCFIFIHTYAVNIPVSDEWDFVPMVKSIRDGGAFWLDQYFWLHADQRIIFPNLVMVADVLLASWNVIYEMYFGWILLCISAYLMYLLLKKTGEKLTYLIIPITVFLFNPAQYQNLLWGYVSNLWFIPLVGIIGSIYFLNKSQLKINTFILAMICAVVASFSNLNGLLVWIVGAISLYYTDEKRKIYLSSWLVCAAIVFLLYFTNYSTSHKGIQFSLLFTSKSLNFVLLYLSNGFIPHLVVLDKIQLITGIFVISSIFGIPLILRLKKMEMRKVLPWFQFGLIGVLSAIVTDLGRLGLTSPVGVRYATMAALGQISTIVLLSILFVHFYHNSGQRKKKLIYTFLYSFFVIAIGLTMSVTYYGGWVAGSVWHNYYTPIFDCMTKPNSDFACDFNTNVDVPTEQKYATILKENHLSMFSDQNTVSTKLLDPLLSENNWINMTGDLMGTGNIDFIGIQNTTSDIQLQQPLSQTKPEIIEGDRSKILMPIFGWGYLAKNMEVEKSYVFIDNEVNSLAYYGDWHGSNTFDQSHSFSGWHGFVDLRKLSAGCHDVSIRFVNGNHYYQINTTSKLCLR